MLSEENMFLSIYLKKRKTQIFMVVLVLLVVPTEIRTGHLPDSSQQL